MRTILGQSDAVALSESTVLKDFSYERLDSTQSDIEDTLKAPESENYEVEASESKKVRLDAEEDDLARLLRRLEVLENDNMRLSAELQSIHATKVAAEAKVESLLTDRVRLEIELVRERAKRIFGAETLPVDSRDKDMNASVAVVSDSSSSRDAATSPEPSRRSFSKPCLHPHFFKKMEENITKMVQMGIITVTSCSPDDVVLVFWDTAHGNYAIYQESPTLYFLHSDCVDSLSAGMNSNGSRKWVLAVVTDKEYCHARKVKFSNDLRDGVILNYVA